MPNREINVRIASLRKLHEYKRADIAEFLKMKTSTYSQMERNGNITGEVIIKLAEIFDVDPIIILCGEKNEKPPEKPVPKDKKLTNLESNIIKIFRTLNREKQEDICDYISKVARLGKYKNTKNKKRNA